MRPTTSKVPNDYYIRNQNTKLRSLDYSTDVSVSIVNWTDCCESMDADKSRFFAAFNGRDSDDLYHGAESQYWVTVEDGIVVKIEEQYLP